MKKGSFFCMLVLSFVMALIGCAMDVGGGKVVVSSSEFGSITVSTSSSRKLDIPQITSATVSVSGYKMETRSVTTNISNGKGSITVNKIPAGKKRIVTVQALSGTNKLSGVIIRAVADITAGENTPVTVNWETSKKGAVYNALLESGVDIGALDNTAVQKIENAIPDVHASLIDAKKIATDFAGGSGTLSDKSTYILSPGTVNVTVNGYAGHSVQIQITDPLSGISGKTISSDSETVPITNVAPGTWSVYLLDDAGTKIREKTVLLKSGEEKAVSFGIITNKIVVHVYNYTHIWAWNPDNEENYTGGKWPGMRMEDESGDWYGYTIEETKASVIVSNEGNNQNSKVGDTLSAGEWWYKDGKWYDEDPSDTVAPVIDSFTADAMTDVTGIVAVTVEASDNKSLKQAVFSIDGIKKKTLALSSQSDSVKYEIDTSLLKNGAHTVSVVVYDMQKNASDERTLTITTKNENLPPVAVITGPGKVGLGKTQVYNATSSYDPNGTIAAYKWTVAGSASISGSDTESSVTINFPNSATDCTITLSVSDDEGKSASVTKEITVQEMQSLDFREETIYFAMTTRFYDGDTSNNVHCWDENKDTPANDPAWRGDFKGLIEKLDYIKALGFTAVWITPVVENCSGLDYHGYHAMNFNKVDPRYESAGVDFQKLIDEVHDRDMKIILDVVLNHTGNFGEAYLAPMFTKDYSSPAVLEDIEQCLKIIPQSEGGLLTDEYLTLAGPAQYDMRLKMMKNTDYQNHDIHNYYHHFGFGNWDNFSVQFFQMAGDCVDLNTENPKVLEYIGDSYAKYIEMGVDAFRIDTGKHLSRLEFNYYFNDRFNQAAQAAGRDSFYMFTEICAKSSDVTYRGNVENLSPYFYTWKDTDDYGFSMTDTEQFEGVIIYPESAETEKDEQAVLKNLDYWTRPTVDGGTATPVNALAVQKQGMDTTAVRSNRPESDNHLLKGNTYHEPDYTMRSGLDVIDFPMHWNFDSAKSAFGVHGDDKYYNDATWNVVYVDSHDYGPGSQFEQRYTKDAIDWAENVSLMFTFRGIPCLYYGSEVGFMKGAIIDKGPVMPLCDTGRAYFGDELEGTVTATDFGEYTATGTVAQTLSHPLAMHIQRMNKIRRAIPALQKGQYSTENCSGSMAFKRRYTKDGTDSFVLVTISGESTFSGLPGGTYVDVITGDCKTIGEGGSITATCSGQGNARIYVLQNSTADAYGANGKIGEDGEYLK